MTTEDKVSNIITLIIRFFSFIKEKVLTNEDVILISIIMSIISLTVVTIILIVMPPFVFLIILAMFSEQGMDWGHYFKIIGIFSIVLNIIFALNIKKAKFMRKVFINAIPAPKLSIPIGVIIIVGFTIYKPFMYIFFLFVVCLSIIKDNEEAIYDNTLLKDK